MLIADISPDSLLYTLALALCLSVPLRRLPRAVLLERVIGGCMLCLLAMIFADQTGTGSDFCVREKASLPIGVGMGVVLLYANLRKRF